MKLYNFPRYQNLMNLHNQNSKKNIEVDDFINNDDGVDTFLSEYEKEVIVLIKLLG